MSAEANRVRIELLRAREALPPLKAALRRVEAKLETNPTDRRLQAEIAAARAKLDAAEAAYQRLTGPER